MRATPIQGICYKKIVFAKIKKLGAVLKFLVFFPLSTNYILTVVEDFKSISTPSKEKSNSEVAKILRFLTVLSYPPLVLLCQIGNVCLFDIRELKGDRITKSKISKFWQLLNLISLCWG